MSRPSRRLRILFLALAVVSAGLRAGPAPGEEAAGPVWLLVDTQRLELSVMRGQATLARYDNIAIGSRGPSRDKRLGDEKTPLGDFRITEIRPSERFVLFLALDYPSLEDAERAYRKGRLSGRELAGFREARRNGTPPPQNTLLGGHIGIHGIGTGDPEIHARINWTDGCIALTNEQVEDLAGRVTTGIRVIIR